ncbi:MAG: Hsp70 family protein [Capsulimonadaceae bacterium]
MNLDGAAFATARLLLRNSGLGRLYAGLKSEQPTGVEIPAGLPRYFALEPSSEREIAIRLRRSQIEAGTASVDVFLWALDGVRREDGPPLEAKRERSIPLALHWVDRRALLIPERLLVRPRRAKPVLIIHNPGNIEEDLHVRAVDCEFSVEAGTPTVSASLKVQGGGLAKIFVTAMPGFGKAAISIEGEAGTRTVEIVEIRPKIPEAPEHPYTAGIDFGTSKSAVFFTRHWAEELTQPVLWPNTTYDPPKLTWWVPSAIHYYAAPATGSQFGWSTPAMTEVVRDMKTRLRTGNLSGRGLPGSRNVSQIVTDFLKHMWNRTVDAIGADAVRTPFGAISPDDILAVLAMPIGETPAAHQEQLERTESAARAAFGPRLAIRMVREPECAAADFLMRGSQWGFVPSNNHVVCVFDCGAGTTDISFVRVSYAGTIPAFHVLCQCGYEFGGNTIDRLLARSLLAKAKQEGKIKDGSRKDSFILEVSGIEREFEMDILLQEVRAAKEELAFPRDANAATTTVRLNPPFDWELTWDLVNAVVKPEMDKMLTAPLNPGDALGAGSVVNVLDQHNLAPHEIRWLCLTGGSVLIPIIVDRLEHFFVQATLVPRRHQLAGISTDPERPLTQNVARGAAAILQVKTPDILGFGVGLKLETGGTSVERADVLQPGSTPGSSAMARPLTLQPYEDGTLYVMTKLPEDSVPRISYVIPLPAAPESGCQLRPLLTFRNTGEATIKLDSNAEDITVA